MWFRYFLVMVFVSGTFMVMGDKKDTWIAYKDRGHYTIINSLYAPFPHESRIKGHTYKNRVYHAKDHYQDSSILIFIPDYYQHTPMVDLVFYFHGWNDTITKSLGRFHLLEQFHKSGKNALFVFPETGVNVPDAGVGKMQDKAGFYNLVNDIITTLHIQKKITSTKPGKIILSGHSGSYRVISSILTHGGLRDNIKEVYLLDAFYGDNHIFFKWVQNLENRLITIITPHGGTYTNSLNFLSLLTKHHIGYHKISGQTFSPGDIEKNRIVFIFSSLAHEEVVDPYLTLFLSNTRAMPKKF